MNPILIDTDAYVAFKRGRPQAIAILQHAPMIAVNTIVLGELLSGFAAGSKEKDNLAELKKFLSSSRLTILPVDYQTARKYADVYIALKKKGTPIPTNDMWIAASALRHGLDLFSYDKHFKAVEDLRVVTDYFA